jgi:hypothetical protein
MNTEGRPCKEAAREQPLQAKRGVLKETNPTNTLMSDSFQHCEKIDFFKNCPSVAFFYGSARQ